jgi:hypothetical protein
MAETISKMHAERSGCDVTKRIVRPDGELRYVRCVGIPVVEGEALKGFLGTAMDITEQELLTIELERQRAHLTETQKLTHTGSWARRLVDRKMETEHLSEEWYRIYGFDPAEGSPTWEEFLERVGSPCVEGHYRTGNRGKSRLRSGVPYPLTEWKGEMDP